ncbi:MAG: hypothetical protein KKB51_15235 [Candidatus Riflebacteria bacterium]|nr:hypothetical protein [Candidatus Riflebacteria bacterium]
MNKRKGMAIIIVLSLSMFLLILGLSYLKSVSHVSRTNPHRLSQIQSDFFAQGIQKLAILKFKAVPADFYHAYRYKVADEKVPRSPTLPKLSPSPFADFLGNNNTILQNEPDPPEVIALAAPAPVLSYTTEYLVTSSKKFDHDMLEVKVNVALEDFSQSYTVTFDASRSLILPPVVP